MGTRQHWGSNPAPPTLEAYAQTTRPPLWQKKKIVLWQLALAMAQRFCFFFSHKLGSTHFLSISLQISRAHGPRESLYHHLWVPGGTGDRAPHLPHEKRMLKPLGLGVRIPEHEYTSQIPMFSDDRISYIVYFATGSALLQGR